MWHNKVFFWPLHKIKEVSRFKRFELLCIALRMSASFLWLIFSSVRFEFFVCTFCLMCAESILWVGERLCMGVDMCGLSGFQTFFGKVFEFNWRDFELKINFHGKVWVLKDLLVVSVGVWSCLLKFCIFSEDFDCFLRKTQDFLGNSSWSSPKTHCHYTLFERRWCQP